MRPAWKTPSSERPEQCPGCGRPLDRGSVIVRIDKGPWTCEVCDGKVVAKEQSK